jgi:predicted nucleic acid-binding protein|tara:strand:- start:22 stop:297 length:276 start_codon:yes stop_codon:yes gene_type:complete
MKMMISATLSMEAAEIYSNWEKQKKSSILSELIVKENVNRLQIAALQKQRSATHLIISQCMVHLLVTEGKTPLVERMNSALEGTIHYQYWE